MLRTDLIELLNHGDVWAFVGAGASVDSGAPTWQDLLSRVMARLPSEKGQEIIRDSHIIAAQKAKNFPRCFSRVEHFVDRDTLERALIDEIQRHSTPGELLKILANWPLAGYVTTNYDVLLYSALRSIGYAGGWTSAGNSETEVRKLAGNVRHVIWHLHGCVAYDRKDYRLVLTEEDYEKTYLESSRVATQLKGFLTQNRVLFVGFSFDDTELQRLLRVVALYSNPARPAYAFLSGLTGAAGEQKRVELLERFNVDVIPYDIVNNSHDNLRRLIGVYSSFILKRNQKFGQPERPCPSYHHETTSLLVYNKLAASKTLDIRDDTLGSILKARVISLLKFKRSANIRGAGERSG
jgi:hypothetical protein